MDRLPFIAEVSPHSKIGLKGEELAVKFLKKQGVRILARNYRFKRKEIDIIGEDKKTICFIEVKTRTSKEFGLPEEAVTSKKRDSLIDLAISYIKKFNLRGYDIRFDVIGISFDENNRPKINYIKDAFETTEFLSL